MDVDADAMQAYYARGEEAGRLSRGVPRVEFLRTIEVIGRTLPSPPSIVADIGGGPGRYTDWLCEIGHTVIHRDIVADHVQQVGSRHPEVDTSVGDARCVDVADNAVDAVLLLGPLYHLREESDRVEALREARRIVREGGYVYAAAITRWSARLNGLLVDRLHERYPGLPALVDEMERTGWLRPAHEGGFTCHTHTSAELRVEIESAGLHVESLVSVESITFALHDIDERMNDPEQRALVLDTLRAVESETEIIGVGPHLLAAARA
jgi:SAM-dependent methyltransferase